MAASRFERRIQNEAALESTYSKGSLLVAGGSVLSCEVERSIIEGTVNVTGTVKGSYGSTYETRVTLDLLDEDVVSYDCSCPAASTYDGMCKHEVALALYYLHGGAGDPGSLADPHAARSAGGIGGSGAPSRTGTGTSKHRPQPTSPQITNMLSSLATLRADQAEAARKARSASTQTSDEPPAELLASLVPASSISYYASPVWCLKLKVRRGKASYVVKNVGDLVHAWKSGALYSYGKNLSFVHTPQAFNARSRALLDIVTRIVDSQQALFSSRYQYWEAGRGTDIKQLPLSDSDIVDILDALQGSSVSVDYLAGLSSRYASYGETDVRTLNVAEGDLRGEATLRPAADGGFDLRISPSLRVFWDAQSNRLYALDGSTAWRCSPDFSAQAGPLLNNLLPFRDPLHIGPSDLGAFCLNALPTLRACTDLAVPQELEDLRPPEPEFTFKIGCDDGFIDCLPTVTYGDWTAGIHEPQRPGQPARDLAAEYRAQDMMDAYFPDGEASHPRFDEGDDERLYVLLTEGLREMGELGEVLLSERLRNLKVHDAPQLRVKASVRNGLLDVAVDASGLAPRDLVAYLASYKRKQRFVRLSNGDIVKLDDNARALSDLADGLGVDVESLVKNGGAAGLPSNRMLFVDALLKRTEHVRLERNRAFRSVVRDFETFGDADFEVPETLRDVLRPYQVEGFRWLQTLERFGFGGILADDMGLGKTVQMIAHILARKEAGDTGSTLIVCPASLVYNWAAELKKFAPQLSCSCVLGSKAQREKIITRAQGAGTARNEEDSPETAGNRAQDCPPVDVLVTSYDLMKRDVEAYAQQHFSRVVLDEAQYIKNAGTQAAKCAKCLPADARFALTGTPVENRLAELWSIFDFLMPGILGSRDAFAKRFEGPVEHGEEGASRRLQCLVAPFILRRLKTDVLADLPEKNESVVLARMEGEQDRLYKATQDMVARQIAHELPDEFKRNKLQILAELTKLRQICCDPRLCFDNYTGASAKLDTCLELVRSGLDAGHRILVFSQFTSMLELIGERLKAEKIGYLTLTGTTSKEDRARLVERFQAGESGSDRADVFLISLKAGGVGLNLTAADMVIHYDPWWNLAAQNQATDRAHRIGQTRAVSVFQLIAQDTIEERIVKMQQRKRDLAESVLGGDAVASTALTREDVLALLDAQE